MAHISFYRIGRTYKDTFSPPSAAGSKSSLGVCYIEPGANDRPIALHVVGAPKVFRASSVTRHNLFKCCGKKYVVDINE